MAGSTGASIIFSFKTSSGYSVVLTTTPWHYSNQPWLLRLGSNLASTNKDPNVTWQYNDLELPPVFKLTAVTEYDVLREVQKLKITKSSAIPNVSTKILKDAFEAFVQQLTFLFNLSIFTCNFPSKWKCANVTPLFKAGDPTDVNNYRPISQLPTPSKILEHLIHTQVTNYFDTF